MRMQKQDVYLPVVVAAVEDPVGRNTRLLAHPVSWHSQAIRPALKPGLVMPIQSAISYAYASSLDKLE